MRRVLVVCGLATPVGGFSLGVSKSTVSVDTSERIKQEFAALRAENQRKCAQDDVACQQKHGCQPQCLWHCTNPKCEETCTPVCAAPTCKTFCKPVDPSTCTTECQPPECSVICPKSGTAGTKCSTVCGPPTCETKCHQDCQSKCADPICSFDCTRPTDCPKPDCQLTCDSPCPGVFSNANQNVPEAGDGANAVAVGMAKIAAFGENNVRNAIGDSEAPREAEYAAERPASPEVEDDGLMEPAYLSDLDE